MSDPLAALIFSGFEHRATHTIVNGELAVKHGTLVKRSERDIAEKARLASSNLLKKAKIL
jgi:hypothetical protein